MTFAIWDTSKSIQVFVHNDNSVSQVKSRIQHNIFQEPRHFWNLEIPDRKEQRDMVVKVMDWFIDNWLCAVKLSSNLNAHISSFSPWWHGKQLDGIGETTLSQTLNIITLYNKPTKEQIPYHVIHWQLHCVFNCNANKWTPQSWDKC